MAKSVVPAQVGFARLGIKNTKGYELIAQGKLVARKMGTRTVIEEDSIDALIASLPPFISSSAKIELPPAEPPSPLNEPPAKRKALAVAKARAARRHHKPPTTL